MNSENTNNTIPNKQKHTPESIKHNERKPMKEPTITKISELQRMNIDQLSLYAKNIWFNN